MNNKNFIKLTKQIGGEISRDKFTKSLLNEIMKKKSLEEINNEIQIINKDIDILLNSIKR